MRTLYFNCTSGISGDMVAGALLDLGINKEYLINELNKLRLNNYKLKIKKKKKKGIKATKFNVIKKKEKTHRNLKDIYRIINKSSVNKNVKLLSKKIFFNLAKAEAKVHKTNINEIYFHEVGAIDSIIDITAASILIDKLRVGKIYCSKVSVGRGKKKIIHGTVNLPVPVVRELLKDIPIKVLDINKEITTPTGAAIIKTLADDFVDDIHIQKYKKGYGAGTQDLEIPNVLEAIIGDVKVSKDKKVVLETNIDDMNPEFYEFIIEKLIREGSNDAFIQPVIMKKNRIGSLLTVICDYKLKDKMIDIIFNETTTFGIRVNNVSRVKLDRESKQVKTKYGLIDIKIGRYKGKIKTISPEYDNCKKIANEKKIPIKKIYQEVSKIMF